MLVITLRRLKAEETPPVGGNVLIHKTEESMSMLSGIILNGDVHLVARTRSLITQI
jgi:hypothetical protein